MEHLSLILQLHTPEELIYFSNLAHWIEGGILFAVAILAALRKDKIWPWLILASGLFLPIFSFSHHLDELRLAWRATWLDPAQRQHLIMAILLTVGGISELSVKIKSRQNNTLKYVFPGVLMIIGVLFLVHPQNGIGEEFARAIKVHTYLGIVLIPAGWVKTLEISQKRKTLGYIWVVLILLAAALLLIYREPITAYHLT